MGTENQWCFSWMEVSSASEGKDRQGLVKASRWQPGDAITVCFLDGEKTLQERVKQTAQKWVGPNMANLRFVFQRKKESLIRISFQPGGSWSVLGTTCRKIKEKSTPTMNFGWLTPATPQQELERVVLHEFGHALGLIHEHQNPLSGIVWDRRQVEKDLSGPPRNWTAERIERNIFAPYAKAESNFTKLDPDSIMLYPIPKAWTRNGFSSALNTKLSNNDIKFIRRQYPF